MATYTKTVLRHSGIGDLLLKVVLVLGDGSSTDVTAAEIGLTYIYGAWTQDIDDNNALQMSAYEGTTITTEAISDGKYQLLFALGY